LEKNRKYPAFVAGVQRGDGIAILELPPVGKSRDKETAVTMRVVVLLWRLCLFFVAATAQEATADGCPKNEIACHDVMNGSQCLAQIVMDNRPPISAEALAKCVEHEGTASNLPGATKVSFRTEKKGAKD
jgi:hypothetical protein